MNRFASVFSPSVCIDPRKYSNSFSMLGREEKSSTKAGDWISLMYASFLQVNFEILKKNDGRGRCGEYFTFQKLEGLI